VLLRQPFMHHCQNVAGADGLLAVLHWCRNSPSPAGPQTLPGGVQRYGCCTAASCFACAHSPAVPLLLSRLILNSTCCCTAAASSLPVQAASIA
jgi:hypothetical protein